MKKRVIIAAAVIPLLLLGIIGVKALFTSNNPEPISPLTSWGGVEYANAADLTKASGIKIEDLAYIPFEAKEIIYQDYEKGIVEILYQNEEDVLSYQVSKKDRKEEGKITYENNQTLNLKGTVLTLKGNGGKMFIAEYKKGGYVHTLNFPNGIAEKAMHEFLKKNI